MSFWKKAKKAEKGPVPVAAGNNKPKPADKPGPRPPEDAFWQRYSPNYEFSLSGATSITVHVLAIVFIVMSGWLLATFGMSGNKLNLDTIIIAGGGGNVAGEGNARGDRPPVSAEEDVEKQPEDVKKAGNPLAEAEPLKTPTLDPLNLSPDNQDDARYINKASEAVKGMAKLSEDSRKKIFNAIGPGKGQKGPGSGGGKDTGTDKGEGAFTGPGKSTFTKHQQRLLRWTMIFNTNSGIDYRNQLSALGAYLAFPQADGTYRLYRNLNQRPARGEIEDLATLKRFYWIDSKPDSIQSLSEAMGLQAPDGPIIAFFPDELEARLLKLELSYQGRREDQIKETHFKVERRGGTYEPKVVFQE